MEGSALRGRKNPMKPAVSWHTTLFAKSSVLYLWRPWVAERGCSGREQALSASHRTGGFCVLPDEKPRSMPKAESACSGVGGAAKWKGAAKRSLEMELHHRGSKRDIKPAAANVLFKALPSQQHLFVDHFTNRKQRFYDDRQKKGFPLLVPPRQFQPNIVQSLHFRFSCPAFG